VAPRDNVGLARSRVDECIVLATPEPFIAVGHHYQCFMQVSDDEVLQFLSAAKHARAGQVSR
jgi:putative phosphoribosyl transferase